MKIELDLPERTWAKILGVSPGYVHRLSSEQNSEQISKQIGKQFGKVNSVVFSTLSTSEVSNEVSSRVSNSVSKTKKDNKETSPTTPKEINKERELNMFPHPSETYSSASCDANGETDVVNNEVIDYKSFIDAWNAKIAGGHIPRLTSIANKRRQQMKARISEFGKQSFWIACENVKKSVWMKENPQFANFDWMIKPNNFPKVLEGNYNK